MTDVEEELEKLEITFKSGEVRIFENVSEKAFAENGMYVIRFSEWIEYNDTYRDYWIAYHWNDIFSIKVWDQL